MLRPVDFVPAALLWLGTAACSTLLPYDAQYGADASKPQITGQLQKVKDAVILSDVPPDVPPDVNGDVPPDAPVPSCCPIAQVAVAEGDTVVPQTTIHLSGAGSHSQCGKQVSGWQWTVQQPAGSSQPLLNTGPSDATLTANVAGTYTFCLTVTDDHGVPSCVKSCHVVAVVPTDHLHVELLWETPADPDQTHAPGADLDLHFAHPPATFGDPVFPYYEDLDCDGVRDPWFNSDYDCYWNAKKQDWGQAGTTDDPTLDLDDMDGLGPENLNVEQPEGTVAEPATYSIGVHYWQDQGFGVSLATVRVYAFGTLAIAVDKVALQPASMWYVGRVHWPSDLSGGKQPLMQLCHQSGDACLAQTQPSAPGAGKMWQTSGDFCVTPCYKDFIQPVSGLPSASNCHP